MFMKKILTFISPLGQHFDPSSEPDIYFCPDGSYVTGHQTNEAPIKYLLSHDQNIQEILCIVTPAVTTTTSGLSSYDYFQKEIATVYPNISFVPIPFDSGESFRAELLPRILGHISPEDELYLETTGGFRDTISQLLLLSRILKYQGTALLGAVYSRFQTHHVEDVTSNYLDFDLITGLNEFQQFCRTDSLKLYFEREGFPRELHQLLKSMQDLSECITLCRSALLEERLSAFHTALIDSEHCDVPILKVLLPLFRKKFEDMNTVPDVIRWCLNNNMIQQALTIYNERMPQYFIAHAGLLTVPERVLKRGSINKNDYVYALSDLKEGFFSLGQCLHRHYGRQGYQDYAILTIEFMNQVLDKSDFFVHIPVEQMKALCIDYMYVNLLRNQLNHDGGEMVSQKQRIEYFQDKNYRLLRDLSMEQIKAILFRALDRIKKAEASRDQ